jgi:iron complex outermembrane receptor protein
MSYATVSTGFRAGGFSQATTGGAAPVVVPFEPEEATSYEIGSRFDFFDNRLRLNPTAFYVNWSDIQVQSVVVQGTGAFIVLQNAAKATSKGVELEGEAAVTDNFTLYGNLAYLDINYGSIGGATGITVNSHFQRAPKITYALGARYDTQVFTDYGLSFNVNWSYEGSQYSTPTDSDQLHLPAYGLLNARIDLKLPDDHWTVGLFGTNLTDKVYYIGGVNYGATAGSAHYDLGRPREYGVNLKYTF